MPSAKPRSAFLAFSDDGGYAVAGGVRVPIRGVALSQGKIWFHAVARGPLPAASGPVTLFGADDRGIGQGGDTFWAEVGRGEILDLWIELHMDTIH
jgi:hypothetical protein